MGKNVLIIGTYSAEGVDSFDWWEELPNLSDYDTVILDTTRILNHWFMAGRLKPGQHCDYSISRVNEQDKRISSNLRLVRSKLLEIMKFDITVYAMYAPGVTVEYNDPEYDTPVDYVGTNEWCPISIKTVREKGKTTYVKDNSYKEYFRNFKGWEYYFVPDSIEISAFQNYYENDEVTSVLGVIATNKVEKPLAIEFTPRFHKPVKTGGNLVLLPVADKYHTESLIEILLQRGRQFEETPVPSSVNDIKIPGEADLEREIAVQKQKLEAQQSKIEEREASLTKLQKHKRLLRCTGPELQEICKSTLEEIGAKTKPSAVTDEFMIEVDGKEALVEVKGNTKSITKDDLAQLIADLGQQIKVTNKPTIIRGILIGNAWRLLRLSDRATKDVFTRHVVQYAEAQNIGLLSTTELFKAYCKVLVQPECNSEILDKLINSKGIIRF